MFFFITVLLGILIIKNRKYQHLFIVLMSCYFYWYSGGILIVLLFYTLLMDYYLGKVIYECNSKAKKKFFFIVSVVGNLGLLFVFKYFNFMLKVIEYFSALFHGSLNLPTVNLILPIGISFYTFCSISYTFDIYRGHLKPCNSLVQYAFFITFFPHLVAGPILRASKFLPQLRKKIRVLPDNFRQGIINILIGLIKKVVIADNVAMFVNSYFASTGNYHSSIPVFLGALAFGIQIYCDFAGYSQIAIGLAQILGIKLPMNFDAPYSASSIQEFWNKWHISLSTWLRDYVYIPLGGNRKGKFRTYLNLLLTMLIGGLWHGAAWNFLFWGFYQGMLLVIHRFFQSLRITNMFTYLQKFGLVLSVLITQFFVFLGWLIFRVGDVHVLSYCVRKYVFWDFTNGWTEFIRLLSLYPIPLFFMALFIVGHFTNYVTKRRLEEILRKDYFYWVLFLVVGCLALFFLAAPQTIQFIYFQF
jgi:alginate O-acetyltransferase complex protein AlgI